MGSLVIVAVIVIVVAAGALVLGATRRKDAGSATGQLSRETLKRDSSARKAATGGAASAGSPGRALEKSVAVSRSAAVVPATSTAPTMWVPPDPETIGVSRRQFLNRSMIAMMGLAISSFAAAAFTAFLWPTGSSGFGGKIRVGKVVDLKQEIKKNGGFLYKPEGRMWVVEYPETALPKAQVVYKGQASLPAMDAGVLALYQKCVHLGCRVPACQTSKWFECPCHGSQYNQVGEKKGGPAPRGLDRFGTEVSADGVLTVDTGLIIQGPPIGTNTTGQEAEGPHCV